MRTVVFIVILVGVVIGGYFLLKPSTPPNETTNEILPASQWAKTLIGKWDFSDFEKNKLIFWNIKGQIEFFPDSNFKMRVTAKFYDTHIRFNENDPQTVSGGFLEGKWQLVESGFRLYNISDCEMSKSHVQLTFNNQYDKFTFSDCSHFEGKRYAKSDNTLFIELKTFTNSKILYEGTKSSNEAEITYLFEKVK